ncbi:MAG: TetR/AcrR family transcriptional regulator C-terminal domain-containing protein [Nakamurella sp.]
MTTSTTGNHADPDSPEGLGAAAAPSIDGPAERTPLSRRKIVEAAVVMIDDHDLRYLTMRRLGTALGVEAMALYHWVHSREDLLDAIVELVIDDLYGDPDVHLSADQWQDYLQRLAHGVRRIALAHPQVFPLIATRPPAAPWVRPPLRSLRWMESFLDTMYRCRFTDASCVAAYRAFSSFLLGHLLLEVSAQGADIGPIEQADPDDPPRTDLREYPRLKSLEAELSQDHSAGEFEEALETLLDRLEGLERRPH